MNYLIKENHEKTGNDVEKFYALVDEIENDFISVATYLRENADEFIRKTLGRKFHSYWEEHLDYVEGNMLGYRERLEHLDGCIKLLEFAEFTAKQTEEES